MEEKELTCDRWRNKMTISMKLSYITLKKILSLIVALAFSSITFLSCALTTTVTLTITNPVTTTATIILTIPETWPIEQETAMAIAKEVVPPEIVHQANISVGSPLLPEYYLTRTITHYVGVNLPTNYYDPQWSIIFTNVHATMEDLRALGWQPKPFLVIMQGSGPYTRLDISVSALTGEIIIKAAFMSEPSTTV
jgi:hypothetical protein